MEFVSDEGILDRLRRGSATAAFNRLVGLEVTAPKAGFAVISLLWRNDFGQYKGFLHAALIGGLIDTACGFVASTVSPDGVLASHFSVNCLAPARGSSFLAHGRVIKAGRKQIFTVAELHAHDNGGSTLVATGEAIIVPIGR